MQQLNQRPMPDLAWGTMLEIPASRRTGGVDAALSGREAAAAAREI
jgi:hypothetical protein